MASFLLKEKTYKVTWHVATVDKLLTLHYHIVSKKECPPPPPHNGESTTDYLK